MRHTKGDSQLCSSKVIMTMRAVAKILKFTRLASYSIITTNVVKAEHEKFPQHNARFVSMYAETIT